MIRKSILLLFLLCTMFAPAHGQTTKPARPEPQIQRVLIISIDGLRPDILLRANAPRIRALINGGSFSLWAKTTPASITLPSQVSMLTGAVPEVHAIHWNADLPLAQQVYPASPTLFELAAKHGYTTALVAGKSKFSLFDKPASAKSPAALKWKYITPNKKCDDVEVAQQALEIIRKHSPEVMFVHFPECDNVGHKEGWGTPEQLAAVARVDQLTGDLLDELTVQNTLESTLLIITADHGGAGRTHGPEDARSRTIPWIANGPSVRRNFDLTRLGREHDIHTYDTFSTACFVLGIPIDFRTDGKVVKQIFEDQEMMISTFQPNMVPATMPSATPSSTGG